MPGHSQEQGLRKPVFCQIRFGFCNTVDAAAFVLPYCGPAPSPADILWSWNFDPVLLCVFAILGTITAADSRMRLVTITGRRAMILALLVLLVAFVSPLCAMASALFSARVLHHILLVSAAAPLLAYAIAGRIRGAGWSVALVLLHALVFWSWHAPAAYLSALSSDLVYWLMQGSILGSAVLLWNAIIRSDPLPGIGLSIASMMQMGLLGALLSFGRQAIYAPHFGTTAVWGLTPLDDQQLAGVLMWVLGGLSFFAATMWHGLRLLDHRPQAAR
jgi:putative membrane protein